MNLGADDAARLNDRQAGLVANMLRFALSDAAIRSDGRFSSSFSSAVAALAGNAEGQRDAHPALPAVGLSVSRQFIVTEQDTAAAMGHPDRSVRVLGSPRLALWFEIVASALLPEASSGYTHVGVGIAVHHLKRVEIGEQVRLDVSVGDTDGRRIVFGGAATVGASLVAVATHQRIVLGPR